MKPIEPGCLAIVVKSMDESRLGSVVTVIDRSGVLPIGMRPDGSFFKTTDRHWRVDPGYSSDNGNDWIAHESQLMRIDGGEDESLETEREREMEACSN